MAERILIIDDEENIRELLKKIIEQEGYECDQATNTIEARACLREQDYSLLLCDIMMPGESGIDFIRDIMAGHQDRAVIMITAVNDPDTAKEALDIGVYGYVTKPFEPNEILIAVENALRRRSLEIENRQHLENLEEKVQERTARLQENIQLLTKLQEELKKSEEKYRTAIEHSNDGFCLLRDGKFLYTNRRFLEIFGYERLDELVGKPISILLHPDDRQRVMDISGKRSMGEHVLRRYEYKGLRKNGDTVHIEVSVTHATFQGKPANLSYHRDITDRKILESRLSQAQKLESIGQLAAGIAHEINTPIQYVGDNTRFLQEAFTDFKGVLESYDQLLKAVKEGSSTDHAVQETERRIENADIEYLSEEIPTAVQQTLEGVERVSKIVRSMKEFSHPGVSEKTAIDINKALESTITISRNEWKYVAEMETDLDPSLPLVTCLPGELNQVFLNMIINAAHAISEVVGDGSTEKGTIKVGTRSKGDLVEISISDTGCGIPEKIRSRIFDPFFTTKKVGKGTGQGLAISHSVIVEKHGGTVDFKANEGRGTTFYIHLPVKN